MGYFERHFIDHEDSGRAAKNVVFAVLAIILSITLHGVLLHYLGDIPFASSKLDNAKKFIRKHYNAAIVEHKELPKPVEIDQDILQEADLKTTGAGIVSGINKLKFESEDSELIPSLLNANDLKDTKVVAPEELDKPKPWNARQDILDIENATAATELPTLERMEILDITRVDMVPDLTMSISQDELASAFRGEETDEFFIAAKPGTINLVSPELVGAAIVVESNVEDLKSENLVDQNAANLFKETQDEITELKPLEDLLEVNMQTYGSSSDDYKYFMLQVNRANPEILPKLPSDILIIQDCSASMTEQKLYFCRQAITNWLENVSDDNRINVASFRTNEEMCFDEWKEATPANVKEAQDFVMEMKADGNTDIYASIKNLVDMPRITGRPVIVLVISDGYSTTGMTASTAIIGQFSRLNEGKISVFTLGTIKLANTYLLEQLSYCNRGDAKIVTKGRWDIPIEIQNLLDDVKSPVLTDIKLMFPKDSGVEVYPNQTENLYLDRELVIYGRYPVEKERLVFQAIGESIDKSCDMVFDIPFASGNVSKDKSIEADWAKQKVYSLMGEYAKKPSLELMNQINDTARIYKMKLPYRGRL